MHWSANKSDWFFKQWLFRINFRSVETHIWRGNSTLNVGRIWCLILNYNPYFTWGINWIYIVHRQGDNPCYKCNSCACSRFLGGWRVATTHPKCFRRIHSLTTSCSTCLMSSVLCNNIAVCRFYQKQSISPTHGDHLVICSLYLAPVLLAWQSLLTGSEHTTQL